MIRFSDPALVQLGKLLKANLSDSALSTAVKILLHVVDGAYELGYQSGKAAERRLYSQTPELVPDDTFIPLDEKHPTVLLIESISMLFELGECIDVLEALVRIRENHDPELAGPIYMLDFLIKHLKKPVFFEAD